MRPNPHILRRLRSTPIPAVKPKPSHAGRHVLEAWRIKYQTTSGFTVESYTSFVYGTDEETAKAEVRRRAAVRGQVVSAWDEIIPNPPL